MINIKRNISPDLVLDENQKNLIKKIEEGNYDIVQISRFGKFGSSDDDTFITAFGNRMITFLVNIFFGGHLSDALYGFFIIKKKVWQRIYWKKF